MHVRSKGGWSRDGSSIWAVSRADRSFAFMFNSGISPWVPRTGTHFKAMATLPLMNDSFQ